jgi:hypothetical protein
VDAFILPRAKSYKFRQREFFYRVYKLKPEAVVNYNKKMGSVDTVDMVLSTMRVAEKL